MADIGKFIVGTVLTAGGAILTFASGGTLSTVGLALMSVGLTFMQQGIFGLPDFQEGIQTNVTSTQATLPVVYGFGKVGQSNIDVRTYDEDRKAMLLAGAICVSSENGYGIEGIDEVYFNDKPVITSPTFPNNTASGGTTGVDSYYDDSGTWYLRYNLHDGSDAQTVDARLNDKFPSDWTALDHELPGIAYSVLYLKWDTTDTQRYATGIPNITYLVRGNRVYDPRFPSNGPNNDGYVWDAADTDASITKHPGRNPALCLLDYLMSTRYGLGIPAAEIDMQSFIDYANHCDENVSVPDGAGGSTTQQRYTCDGALSTGDDHKNNIEKLLSAGNAALTWENGQFRVFARKVTSPETFELTADNIIGEIKMTRSGISTPNTIRARFPNASLDWKVSDVVWPEPGTNDYLTADNDFESEKLIDLPLTTNFYTAQQIAMITLREMREDVSLELMATEEAMKLYVGAVVNLTWETAGWTQKPFWVLGLTINADSTVNLKLKEYSDGTYSLDPQNDEPTLPGTDLPDVTTVTAPTGLTLTSDATTVLALDSGAREIQRIKVEWTQSTDPFLEREEVWYQETGAGALQLAGHKTANQGTSQTLWISPVTVSTSYDVYIYAVNSVGRRSTPIFDSVTTGTVPDLPGANDMPVVQEEISYDGAGNGTLSLTIDDPSTLVGSVEFRTKSGLGAWSGWSADTAPYAATVALVEKYNSYIEYRINLSGYTGTLGNTVTFDKDTYPEVSYLSGSIDTSGNVILAWSGDDDLGSIRYATDDTGTGFPDRTTTQGGNYIAGRTNAGQQIYASLAEGDTLYVSVLGYTSAIGDGTESVELYQIEFTRPVDTNTNDVAPTVQADATYPDASTGRLSLTVNAGTSTINLVEFNTKSGLGAWSGWTSDTSPYSADVTLDDKHPSHIAYRVTYDTSYYIQDTVTFDTDTAPEIQTAYITVDDAGTATLVWAGDDDVDYIKWKASTGSNPSYPTWTDPTTEGTRDPSSGNARNGEVDIATGMTAGDDVVCSFYAFNDTTGGYSAVQYQVRGAYRAAGDPNLPTASGFIKLGLDGSVILRYMGRQIQSIRWAEDHGDNPTMPTAPTGSGANGGTVDVSSAVGDGYSGYVTPSDGMPTLADGETVMISFVGYTNNDGTGTESEVVELELTRGVDKSQSSLVNNGGFEAGVSYWMSPLYSPDRFTIETTSPIYDNKSAKLTADAGGVTYIDSTTDAAGGEGLAYPPIQVSADENVEVIATALISSGAPTLTCYVRWHTIDNIHIGSSTIATWTETTATEKSGNVTAPSNARLALVRFEIASGSGYALIDGVYVNKKANLNVSSIKDLGDVSGTTGNDGDFFVYSTSTSTWEPVTKNVALVDASNTFTADQRIDTTSPSLTYQPASDTLQFHGPAWENAAGTDIWSWRSDGTDMWVYGHNGTPSAAIKFDYGYNRLEFPQRPTQSGYTGSTPGTPSGYALFSGDNADDLNDITYTTGPSSGDTLVWNSGGYWEPGSVPVGSHTLGDHSNVTDASSGSGWYLHTTGATTWAAQSGVPFSDITGTVDADTLNSISGANYAQINASRTITGAWTFSGSSFLFQNGVYGGYVDYKYGGNTAADPVIWARILDDTSERWGWRYDTAGNTDDLYLLKNATTEVARFDYSASTMEFANRPTVGGTTVALTTDGTGAHALADHTDVGSGWSNGDLLFYSTDTWIGQSISELGIMTDLDVYDGGSFAGSRQAINFVDGSGITISAVDNSGAGRVDVTISAASGGSSYGENTGDYNIGIDSDANGTNYFRVRSGTYSAGTIVLELNESGDLTLDGDITAGATSAGDTFSIHTNDSGYVTLDANPTTREWKFDTNSTSKYVYISDGTNQAKVATIHGFATGTGAPTGTPPTGSIYIRHAT